jgi:hypothetical protein
MRGIRSSNGSIGTRSTSPPAITTENESASTFRWCEAAYRSSSGKERALGRVSTDRPESRPAAAGDGRRRARGGHPVVSTRTRSAATRSGRRCQYSAALRSRAPASEAVTRARSPSLRGEAPVMSYRDPRRSAHPQDRRGSRRKLRTKRGAFPHVAHRRRGGLGRSADRQVGRMEISAGSSRRTSAGSSSSRTRASK